MKNLVLTLVIVLGMVGFGFAQIQKTLVKTLPVEEGCIELYIDLPGHVEIVEWDSKTIRIMTNITTPGHEDKIIKALVANGHYNIEVRKDEKYGDLIIDMPKHEQFIIINGVDFEDQLDFEIFVPKGMKYQIERQQPTIEDVLIM